MSTNISRKRKNRFNKNKRPTKLIKIGNQSNSYKRRRNKFKEKKNYRFKYFESKNKFFKKL